MHESIHEQERQQDAPDLRALMVKEHAIEPARKERRDREAREIGPRPKQVRPDDISKRRHGPRLARTEPRRAERDRQETQAEMHVRRLDREHPREQDRQCGKHTEQDELPRALDR